MRNLAKLLTLFSLIFVTLYSCEEDPEEYKPIEIKNITDFGCSECSISLKREYWEDTSYVIFSEIDFYKYINISGIDTVPIDFNSHF